MQENRQNIFSNRVALGMGGLLAVLLFNGWFLLFNFRNVQEQQKWVAHTAQVSSELSSVLSAVKDCETGVRGFLITRENRFLQPFINCRPELTERMNNVRQLTIDNPSQTSSIDSVKDLIDRRLVALDELVNIARSQTGRSADVRERVEQGTTVMDALRSVIGKMVAAEDALMAVRRANSARSELFFLLALGATTVLSVVVIGLAFVQFNRNQNRIAAEARAKAREARINENVSEVTRSMVGDISLDKAAENLLRIFAERFGVLAAKLFVIDRGASRLAASIGVDAGMDLIDARTGLVATALERSEIWQVNDVPENYWQLSSSLGHARPGNLVFIPIRFQDRTIGVVELASFKPLDDEEIESFSTLIAPMGAGLSTSQSRDRLQALLEETQQQSEELQTQQEELRSNNEELEQQARALESQQQALSGKNRELEAARGDLESKAQDLERSSRYKSEFLAKMSHELRTPLNGLLILSTLLSENKEKNLTEQQRQFAKSIQNAGNDLLNLINDILDLSKIEARKLQLRPEAFTVGAMLDQLYTTFEPQAQSKSLKLLTVQSDDVKNTTLFTDRLRLEQILRNFLSNALKFTESGEIRIEAKLAAASRAGAIEITVIDTGIGVPRDKQELIFEAFEQADGSVSRRFGGTGLGLTISRELASLLGGEITLTSEEGEGSRFTVIVPREIAQATGEAPILAATPPPALSRPNSVQENSHVERIRKSAQGAIKGLREGQKTILVVEDDDKFRSAVVETVRSYGYQVLEAADGEVALAILNEVTPDAILLDIKLPGISGLGILEMIKQMPHLRPIPTHMISALDYQHNALRMGALGYLTKPVTIEKIRSALTRVEHVLSQKLRRVLLIEDDERQRGAVAELIAGEDVEVVPAKTGREAVELVKSKGFDCIILDLTLPDVSGFDVLAELNSLEVSLPPVVIYTGKDLSAEEEDYLRRYSESIIIKGARSPERLLDEVNLFLHRVETMLPADKREMLSQLRSQERVFEGKTVLVVDDDMRNIFALTSALESKGLTVRSARNGVEALESLDKNADIDLVLMDIMMPKMDGYTAMRRIRTTENQRIRRLPVIALTAKAMREDHEKSMEAGASDYLPKPVNLENLSTVLKVWLTPRDLSS